MKVGDKLIAIDECKMVGTERKTLTIGKEYVVTHIDDEDFTILDDENEMHLFDFSDYKDFFRLENEAPKTDSIVESVINQFKQRSEAGINKYGTTLDRNDLSTLEWIEHAKQEAMDFILYLEKLKHELK